MAEEKVILVVGGGIAGLSFALQAQRELEDSRRNIRIVVLERGKEDDLNRRRSYSHSLSMRTEGQETLQTLRLWDQLLPLSTQSKGAFFSYFPWLSKTARVIVATDWMNLPVHTRILRYDLWQSLRDACHKEGIQILYDQEIVDVEARVDSDFVLVTTQSGETFKGDIVVAADGVRSVIRAKLRAEDKMNWLHMLAVASRQKIAANELPEFMQGRHGMVIGPKHTSMFMSDEGDGSYLVSMFFPSEDQMPRTAMTHVKELQDRVATLASAYPEPFSTLIRRFIPADYFSSASSSSSSGAAATTDSSPFFSVATNVCEPFVLSCNDKFPTPPLHHRVVFIGDASHPVSPYGGTGANMALQDGVSLARHLVSGVSPKNLHEGVEQFFRATAGERVKTIQFQRKLIRFFHSESLVFAVARTMLFNTLPLFLHPENRKWWKRLFVLGGGVGLAWGVNKFHFNK